jgi:hypothetical protein
MLFSDHLPFFDNEIPGMYVCALPLWAKEGIATKDELIHLFRQRGRMSQHRHRPNRLDDLFHRRLDFGGHPFDRPVGTFNALLPLTLLYIHRPATARSAAPMM